MINKENLKVSLQQNFGFSEFKKGQEEVIFKIVHGESLCAIFPTGSGKSLCYQLSALHLKGLTLVVSPLLALMKDQVDFLRRKGIPAEVIDSTLTKQEVSKVKEACHIGKVKILMVSVERLKQESFRNFLQTLEISLLVIDEAHCISEWGHNFRPEYIKLPKYQQEFGIKQVLLLTATAPKHVVEDMKEKFDIKYENIINTGFFRENLALIIVPHSEDEKLETLRKILANKSAFPAIVYTTTQKKSEEVASALRSFGIDTNFYHAGLDSKEREMRQNAFMQGEVDVMVATIAFGMGIDKENIRTVVHYDLPKTIENYSQEIGRAGRDSKPSKCYMLGSSGDVETLKNYVYADTPDFSEIHAVLSDIKSSKGSWEFILLRLSKETNIKELVLKTLIVYLELVKIIESSYAYFDEVRFKLLRSEEEILEKFKGERLEFLKSIFHCSSLARTWYTLSSEALYREELDTKRVLIALEYLDGVEDIVLETKNSVDVYKIINPGFDLEVLSEKLFKKFHEKEYFEIARIENMIEFFKSDRCIAMALSEYFSDMLEKSCTMCSVCKGEKTRFERVAYKKEEEYSEILLREFKEMYYKKFSRKPSSRECAKFLCGVTSPHILQIKGKKQEYFGIFEGINFTEIVKKVEE